MIFTIFSTDAHKPMLALNLAALCTQNRSKTLLIDATAAADLQNWGLRRDDAGIKPKIAIRSAHQLCAGLQDPQSYYRSHYQNIIIDADGSDRGNTDAILEVCDVLLLPIWLEPGNLKCDRYLIERIENARLCNPMLHVLIVGVRPLSASGEGIRQVDEKLKLLAQDVIAANLADTMIDERMEDTYLFGQGRSLFEGNPCNQRAVSEIKALYQEIVHISSVQLAPAAIGNAVLNALQRVMHR